MISDIDDIVNCPDITPEDVIRWNAKGDLKSDGTVKMSNSYAPSYQDAKGIATNEFVQTACNLTSKCFGIKWKWKKGASESAIVVDAGEEYNVLKKINMTDKVVFAGNITPSRFSITQEGTDNSALKFPNFDRFVAYTIRLRFVGTLGGTGAREFFVDLLRFDNSMVDGVDFSKSQDSSLSSRGREITTATVGIGDPYIVDGVRLQISMPPSLLGTLNITEMELLIEGRL